jgi:fumarate hydratase subunit beta
MEAKHIHAPIIPSEIADLKAGDLIRLTGTIITGRDAAHRRLYQMIQEGRALPVELMNQAIYYVGPCPAKPGQVIGSCGPTTSGRVDVYTPTLLDLGLKAMIGKGQRSREVVEAIIRNKAIYLAATGGAGALMAQSVKKAEVIAFPDLGTEAIHCLEVADLPLIVAIDTKGNSLYETGPRKFRRL